MSTGTRLVHGVAGGRRLGPVELGGPQADRLGDLDDLAGQVVAEHAHGEDVLGHGGDDLAGLVDVDLPAGGGEDHADGVGAGVDGEHGRRRRW